MYQKQAVARYYSVLPVLLSIALCTLISYIIINWYRKRQRESFTTFEDPKVEELYLRLKVVFPELDDLDISASNRSFTINKEHIYLCTKDERGQYYSDNMLVYVLLHELAHTQCKDIDHTDNYKRIFRELLKRAEEHGLYNPHIEPVDNYCEY